MFNILNNMEEIKKNDAATIAAENQTQMISVEQASNQMQELAKQANAKLQQLGIHAQQLESMLRDKTVDYLFKVIKYSHHFESEFVIKCIAVIENYLTQTALTEPKVEDDSDTTTTKED